MTGSRRPWLLRPARVAVLIAALTGLAISAPGASAGRAHAARCVVGTGGPVIKYPTIYAFGRFCSPTARTAPASVILQGRIDGKWTRITGVTKQLHMLPGRIYDAEDARHPLHGASPLDTDAHLRGAQDGPLPRADVRDRQFRHSDLLHLGLVRVPYGVVGCAFPALELRIISEDAAGVWG